MSQNLPMRSSLGTCQHHVSTCHKNRVLNVLRLREHRPQPFLLLGQFWPPNTTDYLQRAPSHTPNPLRSPKHERRSGVCVHTASSSSRSSHFTPLKSCEPCRASARLLPRASPPAAARRQCAAAGEVEIVRLCI